ncbi:MAG: Gmad2 immunoglobulin-like domain-containing protein [Acidimicrobiales bacterium]
MTPEDRLRQAIAARTTSVEPSADALQHIEEKLMEAKDDDNRKRLAIGIGAAAAVVAVVVGALVLTGDDDTPVTSDTTTTEQSTTTTEATTTTVDSTTTTVPFQTVDPARAVFPDPTTSRRFQDPVALVRAFATDLVGYSDPVVGDFMQGDSRSGEVELRGFADGAPTVVLVRLLEDDTWFVIGAVTDSIQLTAPASGDQVSSPLALAGSAHAFEGTVDVRLFADGATEPIAETFVTGRGDGVLGEFTGELTFTVPPGVTHGVLVLTSGGGLDGAAVYAQVLRVAF